MIAIISDNRWIHFDNVTPDIDDLMYNHFSAEDKQARYIDSVEEQSWDGVYRKYNKKYQRLAIGYLQDLKKFCKKYDIPLDISDRRPPCKYPMFKEEDVNENILSGITLMPHQVEGIKACVKHDVGHFWYTTGAGKTELMCGIAKLLNCPTIIIAEERVVVEQIKGRLSLRDVADDIGIFYAGKMPNDQLVCVGSLASLMSPPKIKRKKNETLEKYEVRLKGYKTRVKNHKIYRKLLEKCELLMIDECVHGSSRISTDIGFIEAEHLYERICNKIPTRAKVGNDYYNITDCQRQTKQSVTVTTSRGHKLITSPNHKFMVWHKNVVIEKYCQDLIEGDLLLLNNIKQITNKKSFDFRRYYALGLFIGDGHLQNNIQVKIGVRKDTESWDNACSQIIELFGGNYTKHTNNRNDTIFRIKSEGFVSWLKQKGFKPGRKMGNMETSFDIQNQNQAAGLLCGLFDAEGTSYEHYLKFECADENLSQLFTNLLGYLGIGSSIFIGNHRKNNKEIHKKTHRVAITGVDCNMYEELVGFGFIRKFKNSRHYKDSSSFIESRIISEISGIDDYLDLSRILKEDKRKFVRNSLVSLDRFNGWLKKLSINNVIDNYKVEPVKNVKFGKNDLFYDFTVEEAHMFEANNILVHNCDKAASNKQYRKIVQQYTNSRYVYGFTGTLPMPEDKLDLLNLTEVLGSVIAKSDRRYLEKIGRIIPVKYIMAVFGEDNRQDRSAFDIAVRECIEENDKLHNKIKKITESFGDENFMILVENIKLGESLEAKIEGSQFIHGMTSKKKRDKAIKDFEEKRLKVLIGSKILKRGLDLKGGVDNLILAASSKKDSELEQKVGRAVRINDRGWARVFDFMFIGNYYLYKHSRRRLKRMVQLGYPTIVSAPRKILDGEDVIKQGFNLFKYV